MKQKLSPLGDVGWAEARSSVKIVKGFKTTGRGLKTTFNDVLRSLPRELGIGWVMLWMT